MSYPIGEIADVFLNKARVANESLSTLTLHKLLYTATGYHLAMTGEKLVAGTFEASDFGPRHPDLAAALARFGQHQIPLHFQLATEGGRALEPAVCALLDAVWTEVKGTRSLSLRSSTLSRTSPWGRTRSQRSPEGPNLIPDELVRQHFSAILSDRANRARSA
jgi:uncharacterized phage-associated protein